MWTIFKVFIEFLLLFYVLVFWLRGMWDLSSPTRDRTRTPCIGMRSLNHWTTREVPGCYYNVVTMGRSQMVVVEIACGIICQFLGLVRIDMSRKENSAQSPEKEHVKELLSIVCPGTRV